jgi:hypothetical protein
LTRRLLTRQREAQIKGYFHRHGFKILVSGRFVPGFRTAAYLTAGILKLPPLKLLVTDLVAVSLSTTMMFGLGWAFAYQIQEGIREVQQWVTVVVAIGVGGWLLYRYDQARRRSGLPVGPPVLDTDEVPLPTLDVAPVLRPTDPISTSSTPVSSGIEPLPVTLPGASRAHRDILAVAADGPSAAPKSTAIDAATRVRPVAPAHGAPDDPVGIAVDGAAHSPPIESPSR